MKTNAQLKKIRQAEAQAQLTERNIKTTYYVNTDKMAALRITRSMHRHTAVPNCITLMQRDEFHPDYSAQFAEVWDEDANEILVWIKRGVNGKMEITYFFDPITGVKLREQPHLADKPITDRVYQQRLGKYLGELVNAAGAGDADAQIDKFFEKIAQLREQKGV